MLEKMTEKSINTNKLKDALHVCRRQIYVEIF